jgi:hypothetical protein
LKESPSRFARTDIPRIDVGINLITAQLQSRPVVAFVSVLVHILDETNALRDLYVEMSIVPHQQEWIVGHHVTVVDLSRPLVG